MIRQSIVYVDSINQTRELNGGAYVKCSNRNPTHVLTTGFHIAAEQVKEYHINDELLITIEEPS